MINIPTVDLAPKVVGIGNSSGRDIDKFAEFGLTPGKAAKVEAPLIAECYANFECKLVDSSLINKYSLFVWEVVKAHVAASPKYPRTLHYRGDGVFMVSGANTSRYREALQVAEFVMFATRRRRATRRRWLGITRRTLSCSASAACAAPGRASRSLRQAGPC